MYANRWYQNMSVGPLQQEKIWDMTHPQGYKDPESITGVIYSKPMELDKPTGVDREKRGKVLKTMGIILVAAAACGLAYWTVALFRMFFV